MLNQVSKYVLFPLAVGVAGLLLVFAWGTANQAVVGGVALGLIEAPAQNECLVAETVSDYGVKFETCASGNGFGVLAAGSGTATADAHPDTLTFTSDNQYLTINATDTDDSVTFDLGAGRCGRSLSESSDACDVDVLTTGSDGDSSTQESDSGLEFVGDELSLLRGCPNGAMLIWLETGDDWNCGLNNAFSFWVVPAGDNFVADSVGDTLTITDERLTVTGTAGTDTIDFAADEELYSHSCDWSIVSATETLDNLVCTPHDSLPITVTRVFCITETGNASVTIDERTRANRFTPGTSIDNTMNCGTSGYTDTSISSPSVAAGSSIAINIGTLSSDGLNLGVVIDFTKDD